MSQTGLKDGDLIVNGQGIYRLEVIAQQFNYTLVDLNLLDILIAQNTSLETARLKATLEKRIENLEQGRPIQIIAKSADITHGLFINELGIDFILDGPQGNETLGPSRDKISDLPSVDTTIRAYCNIYCGDGHSEMYFELIIGQGFEFQGNSIDVLGDWRVWVLFGLFFLATAFVVTLAIIKPKGRFRREDEI